MDDVVIDLLNAKWNTFIKFRFDDLIIKKNNNITIIMKYFLHVCWQVLPLLSSLLFVLFYLLLEWDTFLNMIAELIPVRFRETFFKLAKEVDVLLSHYLRGQVLVMIVLACFYSLGLLLIGVQSAIPLGMFTGLVTFIPYVGFLISFILSAMATLLQFGPGNALIAVLALYGVGQLLEGFVLTPRLVGERIGLHPVAVLFALMVFGQLFGFFGILLAFPMSAICLVTIRHFKHKLLTSQWFNSNT